jgi:tetratricopeptide (TPR) repeat protein
MTFFELEKECRKRRLIKSILIYSLLALVLIIVLLITSKFYFNKTVNETNTTKEVNKTKKNINSNKRVLKPIIDLDIKEVHKKETENKKTEKKVLKSNSSKKIHNEKKEKIILNSKTLPSFDTCITLANKYYKEKDYESALKWAKNANLQNNQDPKSWMIVAKSLYKLGKKEKALKILQVYYKYTKNKDVLELIQRIKSDKI